MKKGYALIGLLMALTMTSCGSSQPSSSKASIPSIDWDSFFNISSTSSTDISIPSIPINTSSNQPWSSSIESWRFTKVPTPEGFDRDVYAYGGNFYSFYKEWLYNYDAQKKAERLGGNILDGGYPTLKNVVEEFAKVNAFNWDEIGYIQLGSYKNGNDFYRFDDTKIDLGSYEFNDGIADLSGGQRGQLVYGWYTKGGYPYKYYSYMYVKYLACTYIIEWDNYEDIGVPKEDGYLIKKISSQEELFKNTYNAKAELYLANDIVLDDDFTFIEDFKYALDGKGHTIYVRPKNANSDSKINFIKTLSGSIKNVNFEIEVSSTDEFSNLAGLIEENKGTLDNVTVTGSITAPNVSNVSGIVGKNSGTIKNLTSKVEIEAKDNVGGIVGNLTSGGTIENCTNDADITGKDNVGGLFGNVETNAETTFNNLTNKGAITGQSYVGGLIGKMNFTDKVVSGKSLVNDANVTGTKYVGGVIGYGKANNASSHLDDATSISTTITGGAYSGVVAGYLDKIILNKPVNKDSVLSTEEFDLDDKGTKVSYVGGIVGRGYIVNDATNEVEVFAKGKYVGGISGYATGAFTGCKNISNVEGESDYVGGLAGYITSAKSFTDLSNTAEITGKNYVGGLFGYASANESNEYTVTIKGTTDKAVENTGDILGVNYVGGLFGSASFNNGIIKTEKVNNKGNINGVSHLGGLFGYADTNKNASYIKLSNVTEVTITGETTYIGGIAGELVNILVDNCKNDGTQIVVSDVDIDDQGNPISYVGGYAGKGYTFNNLTNDADIMALGRYVGGIVGYASGSITECTNNQDVYSQNDYVGGIAGYVNGAYNFEKNTNNGDINGRDYVGGNFGYIVSEYSSAYDAIYNELKNLGDVTGRNYVAGIAGYVKHDPSKGNATLKGTKLTNEGTITATKDEPVVGGIFAYAFTDGTNSYVILCNNTDDNVDWYGQLVNIANRDAE